MERRKQLPIRRKNLSRGVNGLIGLINIELRAGESGLGYGPDKL